MKNCTECNRNLTKDEIGLNKKLINKNTKQFLCMQHLAEFLETDIETLSYKVEEFKEEGCTLFI